MKKSILFSVKWLFRLASLGLILSFAVLILLPTNQDMITMIKNDYPAWMLKLSQLWDNSALQRDDTLGSRSALQWAAARTSYPNVISFLVQKGNDLNESIPTSQATPLQFAIEQNPNISIVERLLELGADPDFVLADGRTAFLVAACFAKDGKLLKIFQKHKADIKRVDIDNQANALHWAADHNNNLEVIQYLISNGFDVNNLDGMQRTPLMKVATGNQNPQIMQFLIEQGAVLDAQDKNWETALIRGCREGKNPQVLQVLLDAGANVHLTNNQQRTALDYARQNKALQNSTFLAGLERLTQS